MRSGAVRFYERHGFTVVSLREKERLLRKYWSLPDRQIEDVRGAGRLVHIGAPTVLVRGLPNQLIGSAAGSI